MTSHNSTAYHVHRHNKKNIFMRVCLFGFIFLVSSLVYLQCYVVEGVQYYIMESNYGVTRGEMHYLGNLVKIIREEGPISSVHLVMRSRKSNSYFEKMRKFISEYYHDITYDKEQKHWVAIKTEEVESG